MEPHSTMIKMYFINSLNLHQPPLHNAWSAMRVKQGVPALNDQCMRLGQQSVKSLTTLPQVTHPSMYNIVIRSELLRQPVIQYCSQTERNVSSAVPETQLLLRDITWYLPLGVHWNEKNQVSYIQTKNIPEPQGNLLALLDKALSYLFMHCLRYVFRPSMYIHDSARQTPKSFVMRALL